MARVDHLFDCFADKLLKAYDVLAAEGDTEAIEDLVQYVSPQRYAIPTEEIRSQWSRYYFTGRYNWLTVRWINHHLTGGWAIEMHDINGLDLYFEKEADAVMFKMRWYNED